MSGRARHYLWLLIFLAAEVAGFGAFLQYYSPPPDSTATLSQNGNWRVVRRRDDAGDLRCFVMSKDPLGIYAYQIGGEDALYWLLNQKDGSERWKYEIDHDRVGILGLAHNIGPAIVFPGALFDRVLEGELLQLQPLLQSDGKKEVLVLDLTGLKQTYNNYLAMCPETIA